VPRRRARKKLRVPSTLAPIRESWNAKRKIHP
jgi:hypothetical protein